jgi:hypothetical protein
LLYWDSPRFALRDVTIPVISDIESPNSIQKTSNTFGYDDAAPSVVLAFVAQPCFWSYRQVGSSHEIGMQAKLT